MSVGDLHAVLNANQRRHFEVLFAGLEDALLEIEELSVGRTENAAEGRVLTATDHDLPAGFRDASRPILARLRATLEALAAALELRPRRLSTSRIVRALLVSQVVRLEDSYAEGLRGYGAVHANLSSGLHPILDELRKELTALSLLTDGGDHARLQGRAGSHAHPHRRA